MHTARQDTLEVHKNHTQTKNCQSSGGNKAPLMSNSFQIVGHVQKDCRRRKAAKSPMVDKDSKSYTKGLNPVQEDQARIDPVEDVTVTLGNFGLMSLNW